jgi:plastocyanin
MSKNIILIIVCAFVGVACGKSSSPSAGQTTPTPSPSNQCPDVEASFDLVAQNISFQAKCLTVQSGKTFAIKMINKDKDLLHNFAIYTDGFTNPDSKKLFVGKLIRGVSTITYNVGALQPGSYSFYCQQHPGAMAGDLTVK